MNLKNAIVGLAVITAISGAEAKSWKRGVGENGFQYKAQLEALSTGVSWYYNWGTAPGKALRDLECIEFIPMCWNGGYDANSIREYVKSHPTVKYLLGFNEPNFHDQANMTPTQAAAEWPKVQALAKELNLKLIAPVVNFSPNAPYNHPTTWMDEFVALVGLDAFDAVCLHCYGGPGVLKDICTQFHNKYGKEVWMTEFSLIYDGTSSNTPEAQIAAMMESVEWMEKTPWMGRYGWFKALGDYDKAGSFNWGLLKPGRGEDPRELSEQGLVYVHLSDFDTEVFHEVGEVFPASEYISQTGMRLGSGKNPNCAKPIEIVDFQFNATVDYQFDVPAAGTYYITMDVCGEGEPVRYDPAFDVYNVSADGSDGAKVGGIGKFRLTNKYDEYSKVSIPVQLQAGKRVLRLKNAYPAEPSSIHISNVALTSTPAGVSNSLVDTNVKGYTVYSTQGVMVRKADTREKALADLCPGIYIVNGRKVVVK